MVAIVINKFSSYVVCFYVDASCKVPSVMNKFNYFVFLFENEHKVLDPYLGQLNINKKY